MDSSRNAATPGFNVGAHLDSLPISKFHHKVFWLIAGGLFFDGFDIYLGAAVLAALVDTGWATPATGSYFISATFAGLFVGAMMAGYTGDRFGRKTMYQFNLLVFGGAALLAVFAPNYAALLILRFIMGIGLGAEIVLGYATFSEFAPTQMRGRLNSLLAIFTNGALFVASFIAFLAIPALGWRVMFLIVAIPVLIIWWLRRALPESPRWLAAQGRTDEALGIVRGIDRECGVSPTSLSASPKEFHEEPRQGSEQGGSFRQLFTQQLLWRTVFAMILMIVLNIGVYGFNAWLPTELVQRGLALGGSLGLTAGITAGAVVGAVITALLSDRLSSKWYIVAISALVGASALVFTTMSSAITVAISGFVFMTFLYCFVVMAWAAYTPMLFPTGVRMRGFGLANAAGRFVQIFAPLAIGALLLPAYGFSGVVWIIGALFFIVAILAVFLGTDVHGRTLEELSEGGKEDTSSSLQGPQNPQPSGED